MEQTQMPPEAQMMQFILSKWISKPIHVAVELGLADVLADGPLSVTELAERTHCHGPSLYRLLRALAGAGLFEQQPDGTFNLTPMGVLLKSDAMGPLAKMFQAQWHNQAWDQLLYGVQTGAVPFDKAHSETIFSYLEKHPEAAAVFDQANGLKAARAYQGLMTAYDFSDIKLLVDVGGGLGALLMQVLNAYPQMHGILAERPAVALQAEKNIEAAGLSDRCIAEACDFFKNVPAGGDTYLLANILHDWDDDGCSQILKNLHDAMKKEAKLLIVEGIIGAGNDFSIVKLLDLEVFVMGGGRERTENEFRLLLESAGFELKNILPIDESAALLECICR